MYPTHHSPRPRPLFFVGFERRSNTEPGGGLLLLVFDPRRLSRLFGLLGLPVFVGESHGSCGLCGVSISGSVSLVICACPATSTFIVVSSRRPSSPSPTPSREKRCLCVLL